MSNSNFSEGGLPDWGTGLGLLSVYVNNPHVREQHHSPGVNCE